MKAISFFSIPGVLTILIIVASILFLQMCWSMMGMFGYEKAFKRRLRRFWLLYREKLVFIFCFLVMCFILGFIIALITNNNN